MIPYSLIKAAAFKPNSLQSPNAWVGHLPFAAWVIQEIAPKIFVELGTHSGNSYFSFCQSVVETGLPTKCYAVDTWQGDEHAGQYSDDIFFKVNTHHQKHYAQFSRLLRMTFDEAATYFADESIELLHIDGLHTYEAVRHDFETWLPKLAPGSVIIFHDTNVRERDFGVWKLWEELQADYPSNLEFVHSHGLGVLQLNNAPDNKKLEWLQAGSSKKLELINYFAALGSRQLERFELSELKRHFANLTDTVVERDERIRSLENTLFEREGLISNLSHQNAVISDRDSQIAQLTHELSETKNHAGNLTETVVEHDERITSLEQVLTEREGLISNLSHQNAVISDCDSQIAQLTHELSETKNHAGNLTETVVEHDERITSLEQVLTEREGLISNLSHQNAVISDRDSQIAQLTQEVIALRNSTSWRLTKPIRFIGRQITRSKHLVSTVPSALRMGGGPRATLNKAITLYRREGLSGIKRGIRMVQTSGGIKPVIESGTFDRNDYAEWVRRYDTIDDAKRQTMRVLCDALASKPKISVVMPVYNPKPEWLIDAIESVKKQIYPNWELCIADDASPDPAIRPILERYVREDQRIKVVFREKNGHISAASNSALELATGEWVALLDHDDLLPEHALFCVTGVIVDNPDAGLIYSDEDKINETGRRYDPYFKSDWNPDLFFSHNMICHLGVYRTDLVRRLGGFREGYEGSQDYDLALRCTEQLTPQQIVHIPRVLYHWRSHPGSTALAGSEKNYALLAGERALNEHFSRTKIAAKAEVLTFGMYRIRYFIPPSAPLVSLIIPTRNGLDLIKQCIESIITKTTYKNYEILIVDNNSDDPDTLNYFASFSKDNRIRIVRDERPFNYSALNNTAVQWALGEYLGLINNDIEVISPEWLEEMISLATQPGVGAVGARLWYPNDTLQHGGVITGIGGCGGHSHKYLPKNQYGYFSRAQLIQTISAVTAACLVVKKSTYLEVGGLDEINLKVAFNDVDFCLRLREAGYRNVWTPYAELYHHESATRGIEDTPEKQLRFSTEVHYMQKRWGDLLINDPAYSPNLTLDHEDFSYAWPPRIPC